MLCYTTSHRSVAQPRNRFGPASRVGSRYSQVELKITHPVKGVKSLDNSLAITTSIDPNESKEIINSSHIKVSTDREGMVTKSDNNDETQGSSLRLCGDSQNYVVDEGESALSCSMLQPSVNDDMNPNHTKGEVLSVQNVRKLAEIDVDTSILRRAHGNPNHSAECARFPSNCASKGSVGIENIEEEEKSWDEESETVGSRHVVVFGHRILLGELGAALGGLFIALLIIVALALTPKLSINVSDLSLLVLEETASYLEASQDVGVFALAADILLQTRFVLNSQTDYIILGLILSAMVFSLVALFLLGLYHCLVRCYHDGWRAGLPPAGGGRTWPLGNLARGAKSIHARMLGTFITCTPNESGLAGDVLLLLLLIPKGLGPEPDEVVVQVLQKTFCRPLHKGNYLSVITTVNLINVT
jgi:hypothetical protein